MPQKTLFQIGTPLGFTVGVTETYWNIIVENKHPIMKGRIQRVEETLQNPNEVRRSRGDSDVYLFYKRQTTKRWMCAVAKRLNSEGFLITAYPTDAIKEGEVIWTK